MLRRCFSRVIPAAAAALVMVFVSAPDSDARSKRKPAADGQTVNAPDTTKLPVLKPAPVAPRVVPFTPVEKWTGLRFAALPITPAFRAFGYDLYPTPLLDRQTTPPDNSVQLKNKRYKYDALVGTVLVVEKVEKTDTAWLITMRQEQSGRTVCGLTHKGAIKGIAPAPDLDSARARWQNGTVYARKRQINTYDSASGKMGSVKVSIDQPLSVTGVRWGWLPLPPQPVLVTVRTAQGTEGFVPLYMSWTNVMDDLRRLSEDPWTEFVFEKNPRSIFAWDEETWGQIGAHHVTPGMTPDMVRLAWGDPVSRDSAQADCPTCERWVYQGQYVVFRNGKLERTQAR